MHATTARAAALAICLAGFAPRALAQDIAGLSTQTYPASGNAVPSTVMTGFDPAKDGLSFSNDGDRPNPNGNCVGMSLTAIDNFEHRVNGQKTKGDEQQQEETVSFVQTKAVVQDGGGHGPVTPTSLDDPTDVDAALGRIAKTHEPEVLIMWNSDGSSHANVLYGYKDGALLLYDPNFPGVATKWPFDMKKGFTAQNPHASAYPWYAGLDHAGAAPPSAYATAKEVPTLRQACNQGDGSCVDRYARVEASVKRDENGGAVVSGKITDTQTGAGIDSVNVLVDGTKVGSATVTDGKFSTPIALGPGAHEVRVVAQSNGQFAGFVVEKVPSGSKGPSETRGFAGALGGLVK